jgi:hypothetical protein
MKQEKAIKKGKSEMRMLALGLIALDLGLMVSELILWQNLILLIVAIVMTVILAGLLFAAANGKAVRWTLFIFLFLSAMFAFYLGGSRMGSSNTPEITWEVMLAVGAALSYLLSALYIAYSTDIGAYLRKHRNMNPAAFK